MTRPIRRRVRWRPSRIDFATWAVCSVWDAAGRLMAALQSLKAHARRPAPFWFGSRAA